MTVMHALSMSADLLLPADGLVGRIQSAHKYYLNIATKQGLFTITSRGKPRLPFGIEVDCDNLSFPAAEGEQSVARVNDQLIVGEGLSIAGLADCRRFSCAASLGCRYGDQELMDRLNLLHGYCRQSPRTGGLLGYLDQFRLGEELLPPSQPAGAVAQRLMQRLQALTAGICRNNDFLIVEGAHGLLGVGPGLTPSGDDFLVGFLSGLMHSRMENCRMATVTLANCLAQDAGLFTTSLSAEYIKCAAKGLYHQYVVGLINAFKQGTRDELQQEAIRLMTLGHFSGTDLLLGFAYGGMTTFHAGEKGCLP